MSSGTVTRNMRIRALARPFLAFLLLIAITLFATWYFSNRKPALAGDWKVVSTWSEKDMLTRRNVRVGVEISISRNGYFSIGRLGLDGIIGNGICGAECATLTINGSGEVFRVTQGGKSRGTLLLISSSPAAVIVAAKVKRKKT